MPTDTKREAVAELAELLRSSSAMAVTDYRGLKVSEMQTVRRTLRDSGVRLTVAKNRLLKIAADEADRAGIIHAPVGRASFTPEQLAANVATLVDAVNRAKPSGAKGTYMRTLTLAPTMGPGIRIDIPSALAAANT